MKLNMVVDTLFCWISTIKFWGYFLTVLLPFLLLPHFPMMLINCFIPFPIFSCPSLQAFFFFKMWSLTLVFEGQNVFHVSEKGKIWQDSWQHCWCWALPLARALSTSRPALGKYLSLAKLRTVHKGLLSEIGRHMNGKHHINSEKKKTHLFKLLDFLLHGLKKKSNLTSSMHIQ